MDAQTELLEAIRQHQSPFLGPLPLAHSQELKEDLPLVRRHVGPRVWYQALEGSLPPS
jgi:hypothetical protein